LPTTTSSVLVKACASSCPCCSVKKWSSWCTFDVSEAGWFVRQLENISPRLHTPLTTHTYTFHFEYMPFFSSASCWVAG
jgi:hypothetical protein